MKKLFLFVASFIIASQTFAETITLSCDTTLENNTPSHFDAHVDFNKKLVFGKPADISETTIIYTDNASKLIYNISRVSGKIFIYSIELGRAIATGTCFIATTRKF